MADVVLIHSAVGLRPAVVRAADRLCAQGHTVTTPGLYDGRTPASAAGGQVSIHVYPGSGHLLDDDDLPEQHDPVAAPLVWQRVQDFLAGLGSLQG